MSDPLDPYHLLIATPAYGNMLHADFLHTLLDYRQTGIAFTLATVGNESLITRARNYLASMFWPRAELTHLLFLDADVSLPPASLRRMLASKADVVGAPVALKGRDAAGRRIFNVGHASGEAGEFILAERIGTAALLLSRKAVGALVRDAVEAGRVYRHNGAARERVAPPVQYDIFQVGVVEGEYLSEDYWVCARLRALGFQIHVLPEAATRHHGTVAV